MRISTLMAAAILCGAQCLTASAQAPSTIVNKDGTVTFNYKNQNAKEVQVDVQFAGRHDMKKDANGVWTVTLGPAEPDMYPYQFVVDGVSVMDPENPQWFPNEGFKNSLLDIPGKNKPLIHALQDVPHGDVHYIQYFSNALGCYNNAVVCLPPNYDAKKKYPVFYLVSGTTDTEEVYYKVGRVNLILDNLIAKGEAKDMIVVLPYGNPSKIIPPRPQAQGFGGFGGFGGMGGGMGFGMDYFGKDLIEDLIPYVESHYSTLADRDHRGIGGFSRGGNQGLMLGLSNLDKFSYLCSYSSFTQTNIPGVYDNAADTNSKIHLFWSGVGTDDFLYGNSRDYTEFLDQKGITCVKEYTTDKFGHTWMNAKYFLSKTLPLLFNEEASAKAMKAAQPTKAKTGQEAQFTAGVMAQLFPRSVASPEFGAEPGTVTFRISAPNAKLVQVEGEMLPAPKAMTKDDSGVWSLTLTGLTPEVYCYNFIVDGTKVADAQNMYLAPDRGFKRSVLNMPGAPYSVNDKKIEYTPVTYIINKGITQGYVKPKCAAETKNPRIVCLIPGKNDTYESWIKIGHANLILDQLIAEGKCRPTTLEIMAIPELKGAGKNNNKNPDRVYIAADDYKTWAEARAALVKALTK